MAEMKPWTLRAFQLEVATQCRFVLLGYSQLVAAKAADDEAVWGYIHAREEWKTRMAALDASDNEAQQRLWDEYRDRFQGESRDTGFLANTDDQWLALQGIVISAANLAKMFWGSKRGQAAAARLYLEREPLRRSVEVADDSPLRNREVRNRFEHFDEDLDKWFGGDQPRGIAMRNMSTNSGAVSPQAGVFGHYDHTRTILTFGPFSVALQPIVDEAARILPLAEAAIGRPLDWGL